MNYTVIWTTRAVQELAAVWLSSDDREGVTRASDAVERLLANDPTAIGDDFFDTVRTVAYGPLGLEYEVVEDDRHVFILSVWDTDRGRPPAAGN